MKHSALGSALLIMLLLTAGLLVYCTIVYRTTILYADVVEHKRTFEQQKWYAHGILNWGVAVAKIHFVALQQHLEHGNLQIALQLSDAIPDDQTGSLLFAALDENTFQLKAQAARGEAVCTISCQLHQQLHQEGKPDYSIRNWMTGE